MKRVTTLCILLSVLISFSSYNFAQEVDKVKKKVDVEKVEDNLLVGVDSENDGLRISSAYYLGEAKSDKAVIPLMKMLRENKDEGERIMAALSLFKIGDERGMNLIKGMSEQDDNKHVKKMCKIFWDMHVVRREIK
ncbi:MAG: hypothetical protein JEY94_15890 [Melioribacteraceae bacterium]|nr:hypothetical protein [Melioribacteraceae bacterium]